MWAPVLGGLQGAWPCWWDAGYLGMEQAVSSCFAPAGVWVRGRGRKDERTIPGAQGINPFPTAHMARPQQPWRDEEPCHAGGGSCSVPSPVSRTRGQDLVCQHSWGILLGGTALPQARPELFPCLQLVSPGCSAAAHLPARIIFGVTCLKFSSSTVSLPASRGSVPTTGFLLVNDLGDVAFPQLPVGNNSQLQSASQQGDFLMLLPKFPS